VEGLGKSEESDSDTSERQDDSYIDLDPHEALQETPYLEQSQEELGEVRNDDERSQYRWLLLVRGTEPSLLCIDASDWTSDVRIFPQGKFDSVTLKRISLICYCLRFKTSENILKRK
jgi:hypothetical protein